MQAETLNLFASAVNEVANGPKVTSFQSLTKDLLRRLSEKGLTLEECASRKMLNRSVRTLESHCREYGIRFPDYTPANMRKHIKFERSGDFFEFGGPEVEAVASVLGIVVTKDRKSKEARCGIPAWSFEDAKDRLKLAGYVAKVAKPAKKAKAAADA